jgi:16S rRNA (guanine966-N2)-methyltransferase
MRTRRVVNSNPGKTGKSPRGKLRIVAGKWRSRLLPVADVAGLRPTPERVRETLFNWLTPHIERARCLDLFAGTGALGLEALSRGAAQVEFVEKSPQAVETLRQNMATLDAAGGQVRAADAYELLRDSTNLSFDIVFLDPPFADDRLAELCRLLQVGGWVGGGGLVYLEQPREQQLPEMPAGWSLRREKTAGKVRYSLLILD